MESCGNQGSASATRSQQRCTSPPRSGRSGPSRCASRATTGHILMRFDCWRLPAATCCGCSRPMWTRWVDGDNSNAAVTSTQTLALTDASQRLALGRSPSTMLLGTVTADQLDAGLSGERIEVRLRSEWRFCSRKWRPFTRKMILGWPDCGLRHRRSFRSDHSHHRRPDCRWSEKCWFSTEKE